MSNKAKFRSAYSGHVSVKTQNKQPTRTKQEFAAECDVNNIVAKYQRTGSLDHFARYAPQYGEVPAVDLAEAFELVKNAKQMFDDLPSSVRDYVDQDPVRFLEFVQDENNVDKMAEFGLVERAPEAVAVVPQEDPAPAGAEEGT